MKDTLKAVRCVVDTNVAVTANGGHTDAGFECVANCARTLKDVMDRGHVFVDDGGLIVQEYRKKLDPKGQPGAGDLFLKWLLTHEWGGHRVTRVNITSKRGRAEDFVELPDAPSGVSFDPSDRKFLAVACAHPEHPQILEATDSKWWGWRETMLSFGVEIVFLCPEIAEKYKQKMGR